MLTPDEGHLDRRIAQEAASLAALGWEVEIDAVVDPALRFESDLAPGVRLVTTSRPPRPRSRIRPILRSVRHAVQAVAPGIGRAIEVAQYRRRDIAGEIATVGLARLASGDPFDLVVAHDVPVMPLGTQLARRWDVPLLSDLHEIFPEQDEFFTTPTAKAYWRRIESDGLTASDAVICANEAIASYARAADGRGRPAWIVLNAVPFVERSALAAGPTLRDLYPIPAGAPVMLFAGSVRPNKGLEVVIEAFHRARLDGWVLAILGAGPGVGAIDGLIDRLQLDGRVFVGRRAAERDLIAVASSADLGLIPYVALGLNYELATPNKLFEYVQARLPIATSPLPMIERIVGPLGTTAFVDFRTADAAARGLRDAVAALPRLADPARLEHAAAALSWERQEPSLLSAVAAALGSHPRTGRTPAGGAYTPS